jgi:hypothetical protein
MPAQAGIQWNLQDACVSHWIPAFAGMTMSSIITKQKTRDEFHRGSWG